MRLDCTTSLSVCQRCVWIVLALCANWLSLCQAQVDSPVGIKRFTKDQWTILTDLPIDQEIANWPDILDQALLAWCQKWSIDPALAKSWPLTVHCIADRKLFEQAGLLDGLPTFDDGFQMADRIFLFEQPSTYYRRHLLLHEATHWLMYRAFGGGGAPWFMEGMAEVEGTHQLIDGKLTLAVIPNDPRSVPHWGRFNRISESISSKGLPSLKTILHYGNERRDRMDRYTWSWAACVFFRNHPLYSQQLQKAAAAPLDYSLKLTELLQQELSENWDWVERDWKLFVDEFGYGYQPKSNLLSLEMQTQSIPESNPDSLSFEIETSQGWQLAKCSLRAGNRVSITSEGTYVLSNRNGQSWESSPEGLSYQYHRHEPMGKLLGCFVSSDNNRPLEVFGIGRKGEFVAPSDGWLLLAVNEPVGQRQDNTGMLRVRIHVGR